MVLVRKVLQKVKYIEELTMLGTMILVQIGDTLSIQEVLINYYLKIIPTAITM